MFGQLTEFAAVAPPEWKQPALPNENRLHQLAPYIGKLKPIIARQIIQQFTSTSDIILDCFSGSGTIPLEAILLGRHVIAFDSNPYAVALTRAKLEAPKTLDAAVEQLTLRLEAASSRVPADMSSIPGWVQKFFEPSTLQAAIQFADECLAKDDPFLLSCLLSILHHQRPGFLSYPSSHLVPYLRDRKYPRETYPEMYQERPLAPRLLAKIRRTYKNSQSGTKGQVLGVGQSYICDLEIQENVDAIITSPPYMNALDYVRDNRLRMWFIDRNIENYSPEPTNRVDQSDAITSAFTKNALRYLRPGGVCILIVGETVRRKHTTTHPAERIFARLLADYPTLKLEHAIRDIIPDVRRSRREGSATKRELILVLRKY